MPKSFTDFSIRLEELRNLLNKAAHAYYVKNEPIMEDSVYDSLYKELIIIEERYPNLITEDSPSHRIGEPPSVGFKSNIHRIPLHSLDNAFNFNDLQSWFERINKIIGSDETINSNNCLIKMVGELKIDGNAIALSYSNGILTRATTRGDGNEGEDITKNARTIPSIPLRLQMPNSPEWVEVRGEAFISNDRFNEINKQRKNNGDELFANPRNACAGTLRQLDSRIVSERKLDFFAYTLHLPKINNKTISNSFPKNQWEALNWLRRCGFKINPNAELFDNLSDVNNFFNKWETKRKNLSYATDGVVIKLNSFAQQEIAGFTQKAPRWAIALKYQAEETATQLIRLSYQVGRTGAVTPIAEFKPVLLAGTTVSRATLHNANRLVELDLHCGDSIVVRKAGEIIPEVLRVIKDLRQKQSVPLALPIYCPECKSLLSKEKNQAITRCINNKCPAILRGLIRHWVSKSAMDIEGLGNKIIEQLVSKNVILSIASLYKLNINTLKNLDRMGEKSAKNLIDAIEKSKNQHWHKQLYGLGIQHIGEANAKLLANVFKSESELFNTLKNSPENISNIPGIGQEILESLKEWINKQSNQELIKELKALGINLKANMKEIKILESQKEIFKGKTFVITGKLESMTRNQAQTYIENAGGNIRTSVTKETSFLIAGENTGSKFTKAKILGVKIINEFELKKLFENS